MAPSWIRTQRGTVISPLLYLQATTAGSYLKSKSTFLQKRLLKRQICSYLVHTIQIPTKLENQIRACLPGTCADDKSMLGKSHPCAKVNETPFQLITSSLRDMLSLRVSSSLEQVSPPPPPPDEQQHWPNENASDIRQREVKMTFAIGYFIQTCTKMMFLLVPFLSG